MLVEYSKLPLTDPACYVCSAAAHGHPGWVRSMPVGPAGIRVNGQLRRLKFLEFALMAAFPTGHRMLRLIYDRIGPPLASVCRRNRWFADATFCMLVPIELSAIAVQRIFGFRNDSVERLYRE